MVKSDNEYSPIVEIIKEIFGKFRHHNELRHQISVDCPVCSYEIKGLEHGDGKGNLEINYEEKVFNCWVCCDTHETHGRLRYLIKKYGTKNQINRYDIYSPEDEVKSDHPKSLKKKVKLPKEFISFSSASEGMKMTHHYKHAKKYLDSRFITDEMIVKHNIGFCYEGEYKNRIIFPSYDRDGEVNYFVGRSYESKPFQKYKNPESEKEEIIWNEHLINWDEPVYLVEGPVDCIFLPNSFPLLGKKLSDKLFSLLYEKAKEVIIVLDPDAYKNAEILFQMLNGGRLMDKVWIIKLDGEQDIAEKQGNLNNYVKIKLY